MEAQARVELACWHTAIEYAVSIESAKVSKPDAQGMVPVEGKMLVPASAMPYSITKPFYDAEREADAVAQRAGTTE